MALVTIKVGLDNAAFADGQEGAELARILRDFADQCAANGKVPPQVGFRDVNGNPVGYARRRGGRYDGT